MNIGNFLRKSNKQRRCFFIEAFHRLSLSSQGGEAVLRLLWPPNWEAVRLLSPGLLMTFIDAFEQVLHAAGAPPTGKQFLPEGINGPRNHKKMKYFFLHLSIVPFDTFCTYYFGNSVFQ